jgi:hydroxymethylpyrimidine/phosphomethylpyrimidine kinase
VVDPLMVATSGDRLIADDCVAALRRELIPRAAIITPNLPEAAALLDDAIATGRAAIERQGYRLLELGCGAVLIKGGHDEGPTSTDYLFRAAGMLTLEAPRIVTKNTHGTGCSLSSAIAANLAKGQDLDAAVRQAKQGVSAAIAAADRLQVGHGHGPIHHFHAFD